MFHFGSEGGITQPRVGTVKGHVVNVLRFVGHTGCVTAAQLCHCGVKADAESTNECGPAPVEGYLGNQALGWIWATVG